jgi:hypothetical protein
MDRAALADPEREAEAAAVVAAYAVLEIASTHRIAERLRERSGRWAAVDSEALAELVAEVLAELRSGAELLLPQWSGSRPRPTASEFDPGPGGRWPRGR